MADPLIELDITLWVFTGIFLLLGKKFDTNSIISRPMYAIGGVTGIVGFIVFLIDISKFL